MNRAQGVVTAILLAVFIVPGGADQNSTQSLPHFHTGVDLVLLDVSVLDRDRMPVHGLAATDFTVTEDGRPQKIETFSAVELPDVVTTTGTPSRPAWLTEVGPDVRRNADFKDRRVVVIVMDDATPMPAVDVPRAKELARQTIEHLDPHDLAAVVFPFNRPAGQEFTQDRRRLLAAVSRFNGGIDQTPGLDKKGVPKLMFFDEFSSSSGTLYHATIDTLRGVADSLQDLPERRKALFFVSVGIPLEFGAAGPAAMAATGDAGGVTRQVISDLQECFNAARRANVNIYGLDPGGLRAPDYLVAKSADPANPGRLNREFLQTVAENTGGFAVINTNDAAPGIVQAFRENSSYYLLGYASLNARIDGRFRKIEVRVNRPGVMVRARNGYWEPEKNSKKKVAVPPVDAMLAGVLPKSDLDMQVGAASFAVPGQMKAAVAIVLGIRQPAPFRTPGAVQRVEWQVAAYSPDGQRQAGRRERVDVRLNALRPAEGIGYDTFARLDLAPGRYHLRVSADSSSHEVRVADRATEAGRSDGDGGSANTSGSVYCDLDVPDFVTERLSLSGVVLSVSPAVVSGPKDRLASLIPVVPTTLRDFTAGDQVTAFLRVYQGGKETPGVVSVSTRVVDGTGAVVLERPDNLSAERFASARAADLFLDVPIARLKPGPHLLTVEARMGDRTARCDVRFDVR